MTGVNRPTRTQSEPDGICSSGAGQHPATALAPPLGRKTPYAWMWQLGSQRIVGKPSLTINTVDLLHNPVRPLYRRGDQGFGPWTGLGIKEVFSRSQMAGHRNSGDNREHTIASLFHEGSESNSFLFAMPVRRDHQTMSNGQRVQFAPGCRTPRK